MANFLDYIATYISNLPEDHPANVAFGEKLTFMINDELNEANNIFLFRYPVSDQINLEYQVEGDLIDVASSDRYGLCLVPISGRPIDLADGSYRPYFLLRCRHRLPGRAYNTLVELIAELHDNPRTFPQNGVIYSVFSSPSLIFADKRFVYCFQSLFKILVAERIT